LQKNSTKHPHPAVNCSDHRPILMAKVQNIDLAITIEQVYAAQNYYYYFKKGVLKLNVESVIK